MPPPTFSRAEIAAGTPTEASRDCDAPAEVAKAGQNIETSETAPDSARPTFLRRIKWRRLLIWGALPGLALALTLVAAYLKWTVATERGTQAAATNAVHAASEGTVAILSYRPETVEKDLTQAGERLTGRFKDSYAALIHDVVIPGALQEKVSSAATVVDAAAASATENHAVVLVFVNQTITIGTNPPTTTASSVRVTLDKEHDQWRISQFDPL